MVVAPIVRSRRRNGVMVKFKQFADFLIGAGLTDQGKITHLRRVLRGAQLVSSGGQGFASKELEVSDVSNIFLSIVAADQIKNSPDVVRLYRSAKIHPSHSKNIDPWPFSNGSINCNLGDFLDNFFEGLMFSKQYPEYSWTNINFEFDIIDGKTAASASLWLDDGSLGHTVIFSAFHPKALSRIEAGDSEFMHDRRRQISRRASVMDELVWPFVDFVVENMFPDECEPQAE